MKCYYCAMEGGETDAAAVCIVCGMGLCMEEHAIRHDVEIWEGGYPFPVKDIRSPIPRILCPECYNALYRK
jgi:hypothetical protein